MTTIPSTPQRLASALAAIGHNPELRARWIAECKRAETLLQEPNRNIRDEITGPIVDALHADVGILRKRLQCGLVFDFHYRSKIAREFVMAEREAPTHVWEPQTTSLLVYLARRAQHVVIGGAYFGDHALLVARELAERDGVCHAFELNQDQARMLAHNAQLNRLPNVRVNPLGLWEDDHTSLSLEGDDSFAHPEVGTAVAATPNTITVDTYLERAGVDHVGLIMLDIEGGELSVLRGALKQLSLPPTLAPNIVFEVHRSYVDWSHGLRTTPIVQLLLSHGYTVHAVRDFQENRELSEQPIELVDIDTTYLEGPPHGFNMLAVKDASLLRDARFRICQGVSPKLLAHKDPALHHPMGGLR